MDKAHSYVRFNSSGILAIERIRAYDRPPRNASIRVRLVQFAIVEFTVDQKRARMAMYTRIFLNAHSAI